MLEFNELIFISPWIVLRSQVMRSFFSLSIQLSCNVFARNVCCRTRWKSGGTHRVVSRAQVNSLAFSMRSWMGLNACAEGMLPSGGSERERSRAGGEVSTGRFEAGRDPWWLTVVMVTFKSHPRKRLEAWLKASGHHGYLTPITTATWSITGALWTHPMI